MSLPAARFIKPRLVPDFRRIVMLLPLSILGYCFDVVFLGSALYPHILHLTHVKISTWQDISIAMCTISVMRQNGCSTVCLRGVKMAHR